MVQFPRTPFVRLDRFVDRVPLWLGPDRPVARGAAPNVDIVQPVGIGLVGNGIEIDELVAGACQAAVGTTWQEARCQALRLAAGDRPVQAEAEVGQLGGGLPLEQDVVRLGLCVEGG